MFKRIRPGVRPAQSLRHWALELAVVAGGVLLALWAQAWFEGRKEARVHRETIAEMDGLFGRVLVQTAARVSSSACSTERIAELDDALRSATGQWQGRPLRNLPERMIVGHYPVTYLVDSDVIALQIFDTARQNGTMATLGPEDRRFYEQIERELTWLNDVWLGSTDPVMRLSILGLDGPLGDVARDELRKDLAWLDGENRVTILRARSLARLAREHSIGLSPDDLANYRQKVERDRRMFGDCVIELDPLELTPVAGTAPVRTAK